MKMTSIGKKRSDGQIEQVDRISDLPEYILHHILSFLGTEEACRTCILSKKWLSVWDTIPFLDFHPEYFMKEKLEFQDSSPWNKFDLEYYEKDFVDQYVNFINRTMQRYSKRNLSIQKLKLTIPMLNPKLACLIDSWLRIAVLNCLEELSLSFLVRDSPSYRFPEILFSAKSLKFLRCRKVELPYYQGMKLTSLQTLNLDTAIVDETMLQLIVSSCPLMDLELDECLGLANISVPSVSKLELLKVCRVNANFNINQETGSLRKFVYHGGMKSWPFKINPGALRNLKLLIIYCTDIADEVFLNELTLIDTLELHECYTPQKLTISSALLRELNLDNCSGLENVVIDAPNLACFYYSGNQEMSLSFANIHPDCDAYFHISSESIDTSWFVNLKKFLTKSNICKVLNILLPSDVSMCKSHVEKLRKIVAGPIYELREMRISLTCELTSTKSSLSNFLDGVFLICRPSALSISTMLHYDIEFTKTLVEILKKKVKWWKHPLRGVRVESINCPSMTEYESSDTIINFYIKLYW